MESELDVDFLFFFAGRLGPYGSVPKSKIKNLKSHKSHIYSRTYPRRVPPRRAPTAAYTSYTRVHLMCVCLIGLYLTGVYLIVSMHASRESLTRPRSQILLTVSIQSVTGANVVHRQLLLPCRSQARICLLAVAYISLGPCVISSIQPRPSP